MSMQAQAFAEIPVRLIIMHHSNLDGKLIYTMDMLPYHTM